jgi:ATP:ADP antiporter, AAA family
MVTAGLMLGHQVAGKAVRDSTFLSAWPSSALPFIVVATAITAVVTVPIYARLLGRFGPRFVAPSGFLLSAIAHVIEWRFAGTDRVGAVVVYIHIAAFGALLLSGFWSLVSELFDPRAAKASYGRIAAGGTVGGLLGGLVTARLAGTATPEAPLIFLAVVHAACAVGVLWLGRARPSSLAAAHNEDRAAGLFQFDALRHAPHLRTLALLVVTSASGAAIVDFLLKAEAAKPEHFGTRAELLQFFSVFYMAVQVLTFAVQSKAGSAVMRFGLSRTISTLPAGLGVTSVAALLYPTFYVFAAVRAVEAVLRGSMFRSGYELLFVPMDPDEKRRTKTFLDVTCDRAGDALGAVVVWLVLFTHPAFQTAELVAGVVAFGFGGLWLARRLDTLYVNVVERHLVKQGDQTPVVVGSETGWTVIEMPAARADLPTPAAVPVVQEERRLGVLAELRSGRRADVERALARLTRPDTLEVAQLVQLLAWDDVAREARKLLEGVAAAHVGLLTDALLDSDTDFAIRRRIPRVLSNVASDRAITGLVHGLADTRFEVRYQCARAIDRILTRSTGLSVPSAAIVATVDRELSVPPGVWRGHHLIDRLDLEGDDATAVSTRRTARSLEHVFTLLSTVLPREPLQIAYRGVQSDEPGLRGLAIEYLDSVLPPDVRTKLWAVLDASSERLRERMAPEQALEKLRESTEMVILRDGESHRD